MKKNKIKIFNLPVDGQYLIFLILIFSSFAAVSVNAITFGPLPQPPTGLGGCLGDTSCQSDKFCSYPAFSPICISKYSVGIKCERNGQCQSGLCDVGQGGKKYCVNPKTGEGKIKWAPIAPILQINIPTLTPFTTAGMTVPDEEGYIYIPFIGQYIAGIYKWAVGIAGLVAAVIVILGGFMYLTSGGNAQRAQQGKERLTQALLGLGLLLGSYLLLYTINPDLVSFKSLKIKVIERMELDFVGDLTQDLAIDELSAAGQPELSPTTFPYFKQGNYSDTPFGDCGTVMSAGCGPTSLAMVLSYFGHNVEPPQIAQEWAERGYRQCTNPVDKAPECKSCSNNGHNGMFKDKDFLEKYHLITSPLGTDKEKILRALKAGKPVIASMKGPSIFTGGSHFVVLVAINPDGTIAINDPNKKEYCSNGQTKCANALRTVLSSAIPQDIVFGSLKAATAFEKK